MAAVPDPSPSLNEGAQVAGYVIEARIGVGGFGEVYRARHPVIGREVAIKVLHPRYSADPEAVARFVAEARAVNQISHPNIVEIFDFDRLEDGRQFCVMELIRGTTLRDLLREHGRLELARALPILRGIAEAVDAAHAAGIAHRDLKPDNVFVTLDGRIKLIDFGLAKLTREQDVPVTQTGSVFGTPIYMSPEQCRGKALDTRTDLYSFGALAYHVLAGEPPFGGDALELALHHLNDLPERPSVHCRELGERIDRVVLALLAKDPADRPPALVAAVDTLIGDGALPALPTLPTMRLAGRRRTLVGGGAVLVALGAVAFGALGRKPVAAVDDCEPAASRLVGVWDWATRGKLAGRFAAVDRADIPGTWHAVSMQLDALAPAWASQWDAACHASDAKTDPLLHAQRLTCLDEFLAHMSDATDALAIAHVAEFSKGFVGFIVDIALVDCSMPAVLRAQRPLPPPELRDEIARLSKEIQPWVVRSELAGGVDAAAAHLEQVAHKLEALCGPACAFDALATRATLFREAFQTQGDLSRRDQARREYQRVIQILDAMRYDLARAIMEGGLAHVELSAGSPAAAEAAIARGTAALVRSGNSIEAQEELDHARMVLDRARGQLEPALALSAEIEKLHERSDPIDGGWARSDRIQLLSRLERHADAIAEARTLVDVIGGEFGAIHTKTAWAHLLLELALARSGDLDGAIREVDQIVAIYTRIDPAYDAIKEALMRQCGYATQRGRTDVVARACMAAVRGEQSTGAPLTGAEWKQLGQNACNLGAVEVARAAFTDAHPAEGEAFAGEVDDLRAYVDFMVGDIANMKRHSLHVAPNPPDATLTVQQFRLTPWFLAIADAVEGNRTAAEAVIGKHPSAPVAVAIYIQESDGWVLAFLRRWADAKAVLEKARAMPAWVSDYNLAELDAWLGYVDVEAGDPKAALEPLEESIDGLEYCCNGFHYFAPMTELALARALWDTGGDKLRAHRLAEQARDGYARLGAFEEPERQRAIHWLAEHR